MLRIRSYSCKAKDFSLKYTILEDFGVAKTSILCPRSNMVDYGSFKTSCMATHHFM